MMRRAERIAAALRSLVAYNVVRTPDAFIKEDKPKAQQLWAVFPDVPSTSPDFKPESTHATRDRANDRSNKLNEKTQRKAAEWFSPEDAADQAWFIQQKFQNQEQKP